MFSNFLWDLGSCVEPQLFHMLLPRTKSCSSMPRAWDGPKWCLFRLPPKFPRTRDGKVRTLLTFKRQTHYATYWTLGSVRQTPEFLTVFHCMDLNHRLVLGTEYAAVDFLGLVIISSASIKFAVRQDRRSEVTLTYLRRRLDQRTKRRGDTAVTVLPVVRDVGACDFDSTSLKPGE